MFGSQLFKKIFLLLFFSLISGLFLFSDLSKNEKQKIVTPTSHVSTSEDLTLPNVSAKGAVSLLVSGNRETILYDLHSNTQLPIASITKLMTAEIAKSLYKSDDVITLLQEDIEIKGAYGEYLANTSFYFKEILYPLLLASHNEVATALSRTLGEASYIKLMNEKANSLNLKNTFFYNETGLDDTLLNYSTPYEVAKLLQNLYLHHPDILKIINTKNYLLKDISNGYYRGLTNTNILLDDDSLPLKIIGGKTGQTPRSKQNLVVVSVPKNNLPPNSYVLSVVLGSDDRFKDMKEIITYSELKIKDIAYNTRIFETACNLAKK